MVACGRTNQRTSFATHMKSLVTLFLLATAALVGATEFVVLNQANQSYTCNPNDIVQVVSVVQGSGARYLRIGLADGGSTALYFEGGLGVTKSPGTVLTRASSFTLSGSPNVTTDLPPEDTILVTLKITKKADEMTSQPVLLPAVEDSLYSVSIETSVDMENWAPSAPGDFLGSSSHRFFRVKAVRKPVVDP